MISRFKVQNFNIIPIKFMIKFYNKHCNAQEQYYNVEINIKKYHSIYKKNI